jgi:hypothetical protein
MPLMPTKGENSIVFLLGENEGGGTESHFITMNKATCSSKSIANPSARLGAYLAAGIGASTVATPTADAAIVNIDIGPTGFNIGGVNGGVAYGSFASVNNFPFYGAGNFVLANAYVGFFGFGGSGLEFANYGGFATPINFALNTAIDGSAAFSISNYLSRFRAGPYGSADFGPGSYMGFRTATNNYGWLEVTWDSKSSQFEILSGAYESTPGTAILAGAVPEPSSSLLALVAGGAAFARRRRQRAA